MNYIKKRSLEGLNIIKKKTKNCSYSSFHVKVIEKFVDYVLTAEIWPEGYRHRVRGQTLLSANVGELNDFSCCTNMGISS